LPICAQSDVSPTALTATPEVDCSSNLAQLELLDNLTLVNRLKVAVCKCGFHGCVKCCGSTRRRGSKAGRPMWHWLPLLVLLAVYAVGHVPRWTTCVYLAASTLTLVVYAIDKSAARKGTWRTSENTLHTLAMLGGWPGAMLAQQLLRHKTAKASFRAVFWATVVLNLAALMVMAAQ
jgi:uncharacterized membrane protein YsdA (DUF1294 family)